MPDLIKVLSGRTETVAGARRDPRQGRRRSVGLAADLSGEERAMEAHGNSRDRAVVGVGTSGPRQHPGQRRRPVDRRSRRPPARPIKLVPVTTQRKDANNGVKCAVTTGKKAQISNPTVQPQARRGRANDPFLRSRSSARRRTQTAQRRRAQQPDSVPVERRRGRRPRCQSLDDRALPNRGFKQRSGRRSARRQTVMGAIDAEQRRAACRTISPGTTSIGSANCWVTAINALNLAQTSDMSRAASRNARDDELAPDHTGAGLPR